MPSTMIGDKRAAQAALVELRKRHPESLELLDAVDKVVSVAAIAEEYELGLQTAVDRCVEEHDFGTLFAIARSQGRDVEFGHDYVRLVPA